MHLNIQLGYDRRNSRLFWNKQNPAASSKNSKSEEILVFDTSLDWPFSKDDMMIMMLFLVKVMRIMREKDDNGHDDGGDFGDGGGDDYLGPTAYFYSKECGDRKLRRIEQYPLLKMNINSMTIIHAKNV